MPKVALFKQDGSQAGDVELAESVFGVEPNEHVLREAVVMQQTSVRQGTLAVKNRSAGRVDGRTPWRQQGTGSSRQGSIRSPQWVGSVTVFGSAPRTYSYKLPKKVRRLALKSALSSKAKEDNLVILESLSFDAPKTKQVINMLDGLKVDGKTLIVVSEKDENVIRSAS